MNNFDMIQLTTEKKSQLILSYITIKILTISHFDLHCSKILYKNSKTIVDKTSDELLYTILMTTLTCHLNVKVLRHELKNSSWYRIIWSTFGEKEI